MKRESGDYIQDAIDAMAKSMEFVEGMGYEDFIHDAGSKSGLISNTLLKHFNAC